jgi:hypothetical protein
VKRSAVATAHTTLGRKVRKQQKLKHFILLALAFLLCGLFYSLTAQPNDALGAKERSKPADIICQQDLPQASLADPTLELYKIEELCDKPEKKELEMPQIPQDPVVLALQEQLEEILAGSPMEQMIEPISTQDRTVAAFLVGIAFKESKFGVYSPKKNGVDCYNYWGFKGKTDPVAGGYSCFSTPEEAVQKVGKRLERLVLQNKLDNPAKMTVWKCGSSCATHSPESVAKWISDVSIHFYKLNKV